MTERGRTSGLVGRRRGAAVLAFVAALLVIGTMVLWTLQWTAVGATGSLGHFSSTGAFYGAESGIEMALREVRLGSDTDSDGTIGSISNNGNNADDPALATGSFRVSVSGTFFTATGTWRNYTRVVEIETE